MAHGVELELDSEIADGLRWFDKSAAHVVIPNQCLTEGQAGFVGVADGGGNSRIGHRDHQIRIGGALARQQPSQILARFFHGAAEDNRIRAREINVFEDALRARLGWCVVLASDAFGADNHHFPRFHIVQIDGADEVKGAGLRGEHGAFTATGNFHFTHGQRAEAVRIARHDDAVLGQKYQGKRAFQLQQRIAQGTRQRALRGMRHQVQHHFRIAIRLKDRAAPFQIFAQFGGVGDVAIVGDGDLALVARHRKRLRVQQHRIAGRGIARVADGERAGKRGQHVAGENIGHVPHGLVSVHHVTV